VAEPDALGNAVLDADTTLIMKARKKNAPSVAVSPVSIAPSQKTPAVR
jgi:hypothetical protein